VQNEKWQQGSLSFTGLGLPFCNIAVKAHQGDIGVFLSKNGGV